MEQRSFFTSESLTYSFFQGGGFLSKIFGLGGGSGTKKGKKAKRKATNQPQPCTSNQAGQMEHLIQNEDERHVEILFKVISFLF
jgi:hypothetical protein